MCVRVCVRACVRACVVGWGADANARQSATASSQHVRDFP